mmetsp:Transcript_36802/g.72242  ORF Transcript_36802/g.72242 Transcript_36802/m.72242 type:complete len:99 (-) Transcript_36802:76-372(-)
MRGKPLPSPEKRGAGVTTRRISKSTFPMEDECQTFKESLWVKHSSNCLRKRHTIQCGLTTARCLLDTTPVTTTDYCDCSDIYNNSTTRPYIKFAALLF